jgi:hypothetical protein
VGSLWSAKRVWVGLTVLCWQFGKRRPVAPSRPCPRTPVASEATPLCMRAKSIEECKKLMLGACGGQGRSRRRPGRAGGAPLFRGCPNLNVLGIGQWRPSDRPLLLQSCRDNTPCTHDQTIYEHVSDRLRVGT